MAKTPPPKHGKSLGTAAQVAKKITKEQEPQRTADADRVKKSKSS